MDAELLEILESRGYLYDSSIFPSSLLIPLKLVHRMKNFTLQSTTGMGSPWYSFAPCRPYFPHPRYPGRRGSCRVLEIPIGVVPHVRLPFQDQAFDAILRMCTIRYFEHAEQGLQDMVRCLKPGGVLVFDVPNLYSPFFWGLGNLINHVWNVPSPPFTRTFTRESIQRILSQLGLIQIDIRHILLTYRYFPDWLFYLVRPLELMVESLWGVRRMAALLACAGVKPPEEPGSQR